MTKCDQVLRQMYGVDWMVHRSLAPTRPATHACFISSTISSLSYAAYGIRNFVAQSRAKAEEAVRAFSPMASATLLSSNPRVFSANNSSSTFVLPISDHHSLSQSPTIPKSFSGLCKPFHSRVPTSIRQRGFFVKATVFFFFYPTFWLLLNSV